jgi:integrase/recombinase XerD
MEEKTTGSDQTFVPLPAGSRTMGDLFAGDPYYEALAAWLQGKPANTRRSYLHAVRAFLAFCDKHPAEVRPVHVAAWKEALKAEGRADSTVAQRLSALSSYYIYLQRPGPDGEPLHPHNPVQGVERDDLEVSPYERARKISVGAFRRILAQIDTDTPHGARDRALFLFYVLCGRRRREVLELRGRDIRVESKRTTYRVRLKGGRTRWKELPPPVWHAIQDYLAVSGRALEDDAPLFVAEVDNGDYLRRYYGKEAPAQMQAITGAAVSQALKRYARRAGLDPAAISLHSLRHLGAELYQQASGDIQQTQSFLDHSHLNTTQIYLSQLKGEEHRHWQAMANELKL